MNNKGGVLMWILIALGVVVLIGGIGLISRATNPVPAQNEAALGAADPDPMDPEEAITVEKILRDPNVYNGLQVTVQGKITDWVTRRAFFMGEDSGLITINPGGGLLVVRRDPFNLPENTPAGQVSIGETADVIIRGTVQTLNSQNLSQQWGIDLEQQNLQAWENKPILVADTVIEK